MTLSILRRFALIAMLSALALTVACGGDEEEGDEESFEAEPTATARATSTRTPNTSPTATRVPTGSGGEFVFAVIGDYGDEDDDTQLVANMIIDWNPDFVVTVGDNDYSDGAYAGTNEGLELAVGQYFQEFIGNYRGQHGVGSDRNRFFPVPGDHDWGDNCDNPSALDDYLEYFTLPDDGPGGERYYQFREGPAHFFAINSPWGCDPDGVESDSAQAQWFRDQAAASDAPFKVALLHHAPYTSGDHGPEDGEHVQWPWSDWGFDLVLSGHDHDYERLERDGVTYVVNGLGGNDRRGFLATAEGSIIRYFEKHGAMRVTVSDSGLEASFITVDGEVIDTFTIPAN